MRTKSGRSAWARLTGMIGLVLIVLMLAACGSQGNNEAAADTTEASSEAAATTDAASETTAEPAAETEPATRTVETINGAVEIPSSPQRLVVDEYYAPLLAIGVKPIGAPGLLTKNPYTEGLVENVEDIGDYGSVSIEKILSLQPDMILTGKAESYEAFSKIAPTVVVPYGDLKNADEELAYFGELFGVEEQASAWLTDYDKRIGEAKAKVDAAIPAEATFSIIEDIDKIPYVYGDNFGRGGQPVYQALGRKPPEAIAEQIMEKQWMELSEELLPEYAGDYIILTSDRTLEDLKADSIWGSLEAVKNDHVYIWSEERSWYYDPLAVLSQTEELADWIVGSTP